MTVRYYFLVLNCGCGYAAKFDIAAKYSNRYGHGCGYNAAVETSKTFYIMAAISVSNRNLEILCDICLIALFDYQAYLQLNSAKSNGNYINTKFGLQYFLSWFWLDRKLKCIEEILNIDIKTC